LEHEIESKDAVLTPASNLIPRHVIPSHLRTPLRFPSPYPRDSSLSFVQVKNLSDTLLSRLFFSIRFYQELRFHPHIIFRIVVNSSILIVSIFSFLSLDLYSRMQAIKMSNELHHCATYCDLERVRELVESGADIDERRRQ
jgi:hypothetical protein